MDRKEIRKQNLLNKVLNEQTTDSFTTTEEPVQKNVSLTDLNDKLETLNERILKVNLALIEIYKMLKNR